ncbi:MAG: DUF4296 domain-containing protein [Candidatus Kryptoniota bacterium]
MRLAAISLIFASGILFGGCVERPPIPEEKFAKIYVQLQLLDIRYGQQNELHREKIDSLLRSFDVSREQVKSTIDWYSRSPERWKSLFVKVESEIGSRNKNSFIVPR